MIAALTVKTYSATEKCGIHLLLLGLQYIYTHSHLAFIKKLKLLTISRNLHFGLISSIEKMLSPYIT